MLCAAEPTRVCPYDKTHVILAKSYNGHLIKCRQNHKGFRMVACQFDKLHVMPEPELKHHHKECPSRYLIDRDLQKRAGGNQGLMGSVAGPEIVSQRIDSDDWDNESDMSYSGRGLFNKMAAYEKDESNFSHRRPGSHKEFFSPHNATKSRTVYEDEEENLRVPHAPSTAAKLSLPSQTPRPPGVSQVFEYSLTQTLLGTSGIGRGKPQKPDPDGKPGEKAAPLPSPLPFGRGIARYATKSSLKSATSQTSIASCDSSVASEPIKPEGKFENDDVDSAVSPVQKVLEALKLETDTDSLQQQETLQMLAEQDLLKKQQQELLLLEQQRQQQQEQQQQQALLQQLNLQFQLQQQPNLLQQQPNLIQHQPNLLQQQPNLLQQKPNVIHQQLNLLQQQPNLLLQPQPSVVAAPVAPVELSLNQVQQQQEQPQPLPCKAEPSVDNVHNEGVMLTEQIRQLKPQDVDKDQLQMLFERQERILRELAELKQMHQESKKETKLSPEAASIQPAVVNSQPRGEVDQVGKPSSPRRVPMGRGRAPVGEPRAPTTVSLIQAAEAASSSHQQLAQTQNDPSLDLVSNWLTDANKHDSAVSPAYSQMSREELLDLKTRLEKKLKRVRKLEQQVSRGQALTSEEEVKLQRKNEFMKHLTHVSALL